MLVLLRLLELMMFEMEMDEKEEEKRGRWN